MTEIFFSYARTELAYARLAAALLSAGGARVFLDVSDLEYGLDWRKQVFTAISKADRVLLLWSARSALSRWVLLEIQYAMKLKKMVVPILLDSTPVPKKLRRIHAVTELGEILTKYIPLSSGSQPDSRPVGTPEAKRATQKFIGRNRPPRVVIEYELTPTYQLRLLPEDVSVFQSYVFPTAPNAA